MFELSVLCAWISRHIKVLITSTSFFFLFFSFLFLVACSASWPKDLPPNVHLLQLSLDGYCDRLARVLRNSAIWIDAAPHAAVVDVLKRGLTDSPWHMTAFKPLLGTMFAAELAKYTHWAWADLDVLWGRSDEFLPAAELSV
jgi:hypothetical protein